MEESAIFRLHIAVIPSLNIPLEDQDLKGNEAREKGCPEVHPPVHVVLVTYLTPLVGERGDL